MSNTTQFSAELEQSFQSISTEKEVPIEEVRREFLLILNDNWLQTDPQFKDAKEREEYARAVLATRYYNRAVLKPYKILPFGVDKINESKKKQMCSGLYVFWQNASGQRVKKRVVLPGDDVANKVLDVQLGYVYDARLGTFSKEGPEDSDFLGDARTIFTNPQQPNMTHQQILEQWVGARRTTIEEAPKFPSKKGNDGYLDKLDWRVVRGIICNPNVAVKYKKGKRGTWSNFVLSNAGAGKGEVKIAPDGSPIAPGITCWVPDHLMQWREEGEVDCYGTIEVDSDGRAKMNVNAIVPIHARKVESAT